MQAQSGGALDGVVLFPLLRRAVTAWSEEPMEHSYEDGPLDGELEAAIFEQRLQGLADRAGLPQSLEDEGRADPGTASDNALACGVSAENGELIREPA